MATVTKSDFLINVGNHVQQKQNKVVLITATVFFCLAVIFFSLYVSNKVCKEKTKAVLAEKGYEGFIVVFLTSF